uniref:Peptidase S8/S53 domain-containing protein n=1 Tax=Bionectria ochroleuca TaxID=29856 RepID=A0A8H7K215_BIOOC
MRAHPSLMLAAISLVLAAPSPPTQPRYIDTRVVDKYIVKLKESSEISALDSILDSFSIETDQLYSNVFNGFAATLDDDQVAKLHDHPQVEYIEEDSILSIESDGIVSIDDLITVPTTNWNLARISHRARGATTYVFDDSAGEGTCVYILDTGIQTTHPQFGGRASMVANFVGGSSTDGNGHGTAIAGVVGGLTYGVSRNTALLGVKVLDDSGSGTTSGIISGIDWIASDVFTRNCPKGFAVNIAFGGSFSTALNTAVAALISGGTFVSVFAGGNAANVANYSPASVVTACTVGGSTSTDTVASWSNYGSLLDIWAPGQSVVTTGLGGTTTTVSGSIASAHIAGLGAYIASLEGITGAGICERLKELATPNLLGNVPASTVNLIAYNGSGA